MSKFKTIVESQVNILVMPNGADPFTRDENEVLRRECQDYCNNAGKMVRLIFHEHGRKTVFIPMKA